MKNPMSWPKTAVLGMALLASGTQVGAFELVSVQEMQASMSAREPLAPKTASVPGAPRIEILQPQIDGPVASPTSIQLSFVPSSNSSVRPATFKVLYGRLRIDITQRLVSTTPITAEGLSVKEVSLPKGSHRLLLSIEDSLGRQGTKSVDFEIN